MGGTSIWHWLIVLVIVALVFGTKRLRNIGGDVGEAIKNFRKGMQDGEADHPASQLKADAPPEPPAAHDTVKPGQSGPVD